MAVIEQEVTSRYALYNGDCIEVMRAIPDARIHLSVYSPPFGGLYHYSSSDRDLSNCSGYDEFGSSPRLRGTHQGRGMASRGERFIPAPAGNSRIVGVGRRRLRFIPAPAGNSR